VEGVFSGPLCAFFEKERMSAGELLCAFGDTPTWTWTSVSASFNEFAVCIRKVKERLASLAYGNHRKFESKMPKEIGQVISSFISRVRANGGTPAQAFALPSGTDRQQGFAHLFSSLDVYRLGRTGKFDMLCLMSKLNLLPIEPDSCYLKGSTGPLKGARILFGRKSVHQLNVLADRLSYHLGLSKAVIEDALCNFQKNMR
jgi:hypothetical protein